MKELVGEEGGGVVGDDGLFDIVNSSVCSSIVSNDEGRGGEDDGGGEGVSVALFIDEERRKDGIFWICLCGGILILRMLMLFHGAAQLL